MGLFRKGKTCNIAKFHRTDLVICSQSREGKTLSYSQISMIIILVNILSSGKEEYHDYGALFLISL